MALDLGVLGVFKYYGFFVQNIDDALRDDRPRAAAAAADDRAAGRRVSFFTFQAISYVVDVKRRLVEPASTIDVAIYLSFFPHLVAGPIVRAREFLPQLAEPRDPTRVAVGSGIALIALGLVKKLAIADTLAREVVDPVFAVPGRVLRAGPVARRLRLHGADLLRLLRLHGHGDRARAADGLRVPAELPLARTARPASATSGGAGT